MSLRLGAPSLTGDTLVWVLVSTEGSSGGGRGGGLSGVGRVGALSPLRVSTVVAVVFPFLIPWIMRPL